MMSTKINFVHVPDIEEQRMRSIVTNSLMFSSTFDFILFNLVKKVFIQQAIRHRLHRKVQQRPYQRMHLRIVFVR
jgi:hypothetical protein